MHNLQYFGTDIDRSGHYFWNVHENGKWLTDLRLDFNSVPFNPEDMPDRISKYDPAPKGKVQFYDNFPGYTILAIGGSPADDRPGCKAVFWVKEALTQEAMIEYIKTIPIAKAIIDKMATQFIIQWPKVA